MILMEIRIMEIKSWIRGNKWALLILIAALAVGAAFFYVTHRIVKPGHVVQFPAAAISADISAARIDELIKDINSQRFQEEEVIKGAKKKAVAAVSVLNDNDVAVQWNMRLGRYRESRENQNGNAGNNSN